MGIPVLTISRQFLWLCCANRLQISLSLRGHLEESRQLLAGIIRQAEQFATPRSMAHKRIGHSLQ